MKKRKTYLIYTEKYLLLVCTMGKTAMSMHVREWNGMEWNGMEMEFS
jgi:hypothetical protein